MKFIKIATVLFFASALTASAQMPAKRTMPKKAKAEQVDSKADDGENTKEAMAARAAAARANRNAAGSPKVSKPVPADGGAKAAPAPAAPKKPTTPPRTGRPGLNTSTVKASEVAVREFPTAAVMPDDAAWRRDIYRSLDLSKEENAVLYFPVVPTGGRQNLFTFLFRQILQKHIKAYEYTLDANEHFDAAHQLTGKKIMDTHNIYYEEVPTDNGKKKISVNDADLPSEDVKLYFIKESVYYDQHTASFRTKVTAICPVMVSGTNDFGEDETQRVPLFWVNYEEAAPYLAKLSLMGSSMNNAANISADDYFTMNRYEGDIYKTTNLQDRIIAQYAETEAEQVGERKRIESELSNFEKHVWGHEPERLLDVYGKPVLDADGKAITYNDEHQLVDSRGRRIAFAIAGKDSVNVASDKPDVDPLPSIVLVNERGFAVDEQGNPLLKADGTPIEMTDEYPAPKTLGDEKEKAKSSAKAAPSRARTTTSSTPSRRTTTSSKTTTSKTSSKTSTSTSKSSAPKTKTPKASSKPAPSKSGGGYSVRKERH